MRTTLVFAFVLAALASHADARTLKLDRGGLTAWVPDQWTVDTSNEAAVTAMAPSQTATAMFVTQPIRELDAAYQNVGQVVRAMLPSAQFGKAQRTRVAGRSAIQVGAYADVRTDEGTTKIEANVVVLITPNGRALYVITMVQAESAATFDAAIKKILGGLTATGGGRGGDGDGEAEPKKTRAPKENPCWEFKGQPNGWSRRESNGVSFLLPRGWTANATKDPDTDAAYLQLADGDGASVVVFAYPAASHAAAWQAIGSHVQAYGLGEASWGEVSGQRALCARGSASDGVIFHRSGSALVMLGRAGDDPSTMRGVLGSIRWR